jgi:hypothetical protein
MILRQNRGILVQFDILGRIKSAYDLPTTHPGGPEKPQSLVSFGVIGLRKEAPAPKGRGGWRETRWRVERFLFCRHAPVSSTRFHSRGCMCGIVWGLGKGIEHGDTQMTNRK